MKKVFFILPIILILAACGANNDKNNRTKEAENFKVKIITFVSHPVMDTIVNSTISTLTNEYKLNKSNIEVFNPNGNLVDIPRKVDHLFRVKLGH